MIHKHLQAAYFCPIVSCDNIKNNQTFLWYCLSYGWLAPSLWSVGKTGRINSTSNWIFSLNAFWCLSLPSTWIKRTLGQWNVSLQKGPKVKNTMLSPQAPAVLQASLNKAPPPKDSSARRKMGFLEEQRIRQTLSWRKRPQEWDITVNYLPLVTSQLLPPLATEKTQLRELEGRRFLERWVERRSSVFEKN